MSLVRQMRGGKDYESTFGVRQTGSGNFAALIAKRFDLACERLGLAHGRAPSRSTPPGSGRRASGRNSACSEPKRRLRSS